MSIYKTSRSNLDTYHFCCIYTNGDGVGLRCL